LAHVQFIRDAEALADMCAYWDIGFDMVGAN